MIINSNNNFLRVFNSVFFFKKYNNFIFKNIYFKKSSSIVNSKPTEVFYNFFFFFPKIEVDEYFVSTNKISSFFYYSKRHFILKPNYQVIWRYFRGIVNNSSRLYCYRQARLTKLLYLYGKYNGPLESNLLGTRYTTISPAVQLYNWKYIV